jgi:hypothetical protein
VPFGKYPWPFGLSEKLVLVVIAGHAPLGG